MAQRGDNAADGLDGPSELPKRAWWIALKRTGGHAIGDDLGDRAAALTYYGVLSIFPALLAVVSLIGLLGRGTSDKILENLTELAPGPARDIFTSALRNLQGATGAAVLLVIVGVLVAWWSASNYIGAFMRASNMIYRVKEDRPRWKTIPFQLGITLLAGAILLTSALIVILTGSLAHQVGSALGLGSSLVTGWDIAKWPVLVVVVNLLFVLLYWASPRTGHRGFRWITPGSVFAVIVAIVVSGGFALYVANFDSYNKTYGTLATPIIFLTWLWLLNLAILIGAQLNAELERRREIQAGQSPHQESFPELRDTTTPDDEARGTHE